MSEFDDVLDRGEAEEDDPTIAAVLQALERFKEAIQEFGGR